MYNNIYIYIIINTSNHQVQLCNVLCELHVNLVARVAQSYDDIHTRLLQFPDKKLLSYSYKQPAS